MFLCRSTIDHFTHRGSTVYVATLDIKKAFDTVNHYKLFVSLLRAGVPLCVVAILADWYSKLFVTLKWNGCLSNWFPVHSGVDLCMIIFILNIRNHDLRYYVNCSLVSCILYADDVILLSASLAVFNPLPSNRHHRSCGDRLEGKGENYQVCSVQYCVQQLCTVRCTHI